MMSNLYRLNEDEMVRLRPFFPKSRGKPRVDDRRILSGIIFINRNGLRWSDAPTEYGPPKTLYNRWSDMGVVLKLSDAMRAAKEALTKALIIESMQPFEEAIENGVSVNFCTALGDMLEENKSVDFRIS